MTNSETTYAVSAKALIKVSGAAFVAAGVILILFVLPAERGIDITGVGKFLGLTQMAGGEDAADDTPDATIVAEGAYVVPVQTKASIVKSTPMRSDEIQITLAPHKGTEIKAHMKSGDHFIYSWTSTAPVKADMHGEKIGAPDGEFTQYWKEKGLSKDQGAFTAPFDGKHGWYFRNQGETPLTVIVKTSGFYQDMFEPKS
ncbi:hypothetical protein [Asticcacaulis endophyticus]|uniref:Transmembrane anchor protein n=1 Tax=Asticcacaulis endophyticus TaxID=1395890 RepID=A0A918UT01_9CAUL|nr:hypothetical protein [Asticcacaulis endophyticus]GGZ31045.1 hypothetical protein GCM10011273_16960 [Asticcacaulis endophyticus]